MTHWIFRGAAILAARPCRPPFSPLRPGEGPGVRQPLPSPSALPFPPPSEGGGHGGRRPSPFSPLYQARPEGAARELRLTHIFPLGEEVAEDHILQFGQPAPQHFDTRFAVALARHEAAQLR